MNEIFYLTVNVSSDEMVSGWRLYQALQLRAHAVNLKTQDKGKKIKIASKLEIPQPIYHFFTRIKL
jgi:hypothetical protein